MSEIAKCQICGASISPYFEFCGDCVQEARKKAEAAMTDSKQFEIKDPPGLKGGPGAQMKALQKHLREYYGPFRVQGDNPPVIIAKDGEALLSMMWPVHDQTPEGEQAAVEYTKGIAQQIADGLNDSASLRAQVATLEARVARETESYQAVIREEYAKREALEARVVELERAYENASAAHQGAWKTINDLTQQLAACEREREREWIKNGELLETIEGLKDRLPPAPDSRTEEKQ